MTDIKELQDVVWDYYKDVYGFRPRHWSAADWNSREFLEAQFDSLVAYVEAMSPEERLAQGWD